MTAMIESVHSLLYPLTDFLPGDSARVEVEAIEAAAIPQPYRQLLVHDRDMTPTLEAFWKAELRLRILRLRREGEFLYRQVILETVEGKPVEFGAIQIFLDRYPEQAREKVLEGVRPLGGILADFGVEHRSSPTGYFRLPPNSIVRESFPNEVGEVHYGRHNILSGPPGILAEVVEILPVIKTPSAV